MLNPLPITWVKNVYSLLIIDGIKSVFLPPQLTISRPSYRLTVYKLLSYARFILAFTSSLSPLKFTHSPLLHSYLYPLSTPLITTKTKGNMKRNTIWN